MKKIFLVILILFVVIVSSKAVSAENFDIGDALRKYYSTYQFSTAERLGYYNLSHASPERICIIHSWDLETAERMIRLEVKVQKLDPVTFHAMLCRYFELTK